MERSEGVEEAYLGQTLSQAQSEMELSRMSSMDGDILNAAAVMGLEGDDSADSDLGDNLMMMKCSDGEDEGSATPTTTRTTEKDGKMIESYDKRELIAIAHEEERDMINNDIQEPYEGMEFESEGDARAFYNAYASSVGFRVRVSRCHRSMRDGNIICRRLVCSKEGFYIQKNQQQQQARRQRMMTRVGCKAMLVIKKQQNNSGKWIVTKFAKEHNHEPVASRKVDIEPPCMVMMEVVNKVKNTCTEEENHNSHPDVAASLVEAAAFGNLELEPYEGMEFQSEEAARTFYYAYAKDMGFTVRISKCRRARDGSIVCRRFVCSKEGYYVRKYGSTKRSRALTRVGCLARLVVKKLDSGTWVVANFEKEHNHPPFVVGNELSYQPPKPMRRVNRGVCAALASAPETYSKEEEVELENSPNSMTRRFHKLHQEGIRFAEEGAASVEIFNVAMIALREATQKVVSAKKRAAFTAAQLSGGNADKQSSKEGGQAVSPSGLMLIQQPLNFVLIAPGLPNESGLAPLAINLPNGEAVPSGSENQQLNITVPASVKKQLSSAAHRLDGNGSVSSGMSAVRKRKHRSAEDDISVQDFSEGDSKQDGAAAHHQGWNILGVRQPGSNTVSSGNSTSMALSEAQVAALQAVAEAFNVPTMGATSSSAHPIKVLPVSDEISDGNKGVYCSLLRGPPATTSQSLEMILPQQQQLQTSPPAGPNRLVHAAAIAAGARIASPAVAASLIKAVQSRNAVHIRSGGGGGCSSTLPKLLPGAHNQEPAATTSSNVHEYLQTGQPSPTSLLNDPMPDTHQVTGSIMASPTVGISDDLLHSHLSSNTKSEQQEQTIYHCMLGES